PLLLVLHSFPTRRSSDLFLVYACHFDLPFTTASTVRSTLAGFPATIEFAGTLFVTTLPAPTMAFSPMVTFGRIVAPDPIEAPLRSEEHTSELQSRENLVC